MRVRNLWCSPFVALAGTVLVVDPAGATSFVVSDSAEYAAALSAASLDTSGPHTITLDADVTVAADPVYSGTQALTVDGDGFTLSGGGTRRVLRSQAGGGMPVLTITDITVRDGYSTESGGAVSWGGPVTVTDAAFIENRTVHPAVGSAGAIRADSSVVIADSTFRGNTVEATMNANGGAIYVNSGTASSITRSTFVDNSATSATGSGAAGAVFAIGTLDVLDSVFARNRAVGTTFSSGGALRASMQLEVERSVIADNEVEGVTGAFGGGLYSSLGVGVTDSTVTGNRVDASGGAATGAAVDAETVTLTDATVAGNVATGTAELGAVNVSDLVSVHVTLVDNTGGAVTAIDDTSFTATAIGGSDVANCNLVNPPSSTDSVADDSSCGVTTVVTDLRTGPVRDNGGPQAGDDGDRWDLGTAFPLAGSPVVDDQTAAACVDTVDQRGLARPFAAGCDAGAIDATYPPHAFTDVGDWVEDAVRWLNSDVNDPALMVGITPTTFAPSAPITRAQVVRLLYREAGEPDASVHPPHPFTDVPAWVEDAVRWAYGEEIVTGETPTTFVPDDPITRAQVVRMFYRGVGSPDVSGYPAYPFSDVPAWVDDAVTWAASSDNPLPLMTGITPTTFAPAEDITRGQVARLAWRVAITPEAWANPATAPDTQPFVAPAPF